MAPVNIWAIVHSSSVRHCSPIANSTNQASQEKSWKLCTKIFLVSLAVFSGSGSFSLFPWYNSTFHGSLILKRIKMQTKAKSAGKRMKQKAQKHWWKKKKVNSWLFPCSVGFQSNLSKVLVYFLFFFSLGFSFKKQLTRHSSFCHSKRGAEKVWSTWVHCLRGEEWHGSGFVC